KGLRPDYHRANHYDPHQVPERKAAPILVRGGRPRAPACAQYQVFWDGLAAGARSPSTSTSVRRKVPRTVLVRSPGPFRTTISSASFETAASSAFPVTSTVRSRNASPPRSAGLTR